MFGTPCPSSDLVSASLAMMTIATFAAAVLTLAGLSWVGERWRVTVALAGVALLASALHYLESAGLWLSARQMTAAPRYVGWFTVHPVQVAGLFFFARMAGPVPAGVFWRITAAAILMVLSRFLGDAGIFDPTLGVLLAIAFWLSILGEMFFGAMGEAARRAPRPVRLGYFWIRLIFTIGWAAYPILQFADLVIGAGHGPPIIVLDTLLDLVNLVAPSLITLAVAGQGRF